MPLIKERFRMARGRRKASDVAYEMSVLRGKPVSPNSIYQWERGEFRPSHELFALYCRVVGKPEGFFYRPVKDASLPSNKKDAVVNITSEAGQ